MPSDHLIFCRLLLLTSVFLSIRVFSNESVLPIKWPNDWSFSFSISPSNEYSGLITFRIDWFDLLAVRDSHLSHLYMTTGKTIALTLWTFVGKVMSLLLNMLSRLVITLIPRSKHLFISRMQSPESSPTPQFKSINSFAVSFLHSPTLTSIHDYWKNHSLD